MAQSPTARFRGKIHGLSDGNLKMVDEPMLTADKLPI
jgi:hypothetical protein